MGQSIGQQVGQPAGQPPEKVAQLLQDKFSLDAVQKIVTVFDVKQLLRTTAERYGFKHFLLANISHTENENLDINSIGVTNNWPTEVLCHYDMMGRAESSYILQASRTRLAPSVQNIDMSGMNEMHTDLLARYGFVTNAYFPVCDSDGLHLLVFSAPYEVHLSETQLAEIQFFVTRLVEKSLEIIPSEVATDSNISHRESEVLQWIAEGKTSAEIATIMSLSEHTVNHYAMLAVQKLECVNRTQAVVRALRLGLIR